jgi:hypothetical protein
MKTKESIPVVTTGRALQSLRDSGFSLPAALGEVIDNSIEANANEIAIRLDTNRDRRGKEHVHQIVFVDDGRGMEEETLQRYLQLGFSTRYMSTDTIGKYGVGAKLAALNFGKRIDVWSRTSADEPWLHESFDLDEALEIESKGEPVLLAPPDQSSMPEDVLSLAPKGTGTVVVWSKVDRLDEGRRAPNADELRLEVERELSRIFRHFIRGGIKLTVQGKSLLPHDPLFKMDQTWADDALTQEHDAVPGSHFPPMKVLTDKEEIKIGDGSAYLTVTVYPKEVVRERGIGGDSLSKKLRVPENQGCLSFIRLNREIAYTNVPRIFGRAVEDRDRFIGIEVSFDPRLDSFFGVRNVKRGVEPHGELRDKLRAILARYHNSAREEIENHWGAVAKKAKTHKGEHTQLEEAVKNADRTMPKSRAKGPESEKDRGLLIEDLLRDVGITEENEREKYLEKIKDLPFVVESVDYPGTSFIELQHLGGEVGQVIIRMNTRHRFYRDLWEPIRAIAEADASVISQEVAKQTARRTLEALSLLVVAYAKAESMHDSPDDQYRDLRSYWGQFLDTLLGKVKNVI